MRWAEQVHKTVNSFELGPTLNLKKQQKQNEISAGIDKYRDLSQDSGLSGSLERLKDSANPRLSTLKLSHVWSCRVAAASRWVPSPTTLTPQTCFSPIFLSVHFNYVSDKVDTFAQ